MNWKRYTILTISLLALLPVYKLVQACADGGDPYDEYPSFFQPEVIANTAYTPFFYQSWLKYYDDWYDAPAADRLPDGNIAEWAEYTGKEVREADLDSFVYKYAYGELKTLYNHIEKGGPLTVSAAFAGNGFSKWFIAHRDLEALGYLMHAKQCEPLAVNNDWEAPQQDTARMSRLIRNSLQLHAAARKELIRDKYAFQAIRMAFYAKKYGQALDLYNQLTGERAGGGYTYVRCLELRAGALFRQQRKAEAAYYYSRVFDLDNRFKSSAYRSFDWAVGQDAGAVLKLCRTPHERAVVLVMDGLHDYEYGLPGMQAAYEADPGVEGLDVLMTREINKAEERYQQPLLYARRNVTAYSTYTPDGPATGGEAAGKQREAQEKYEAYLGQLNDFARKLAADGRQQDKAFWRLSAAYLYFMQGDTKAYNEQLALAKGSRMSRREQDLYEVLQVLYTIRSNGQITPAVEARLLPQLQSLQRRSNAKAFRDVLGTLLATAYLKQQDTIRAIFTLGKGAGYTDDAYTDLPGTLLEGMQPRQLEAVAAFVSQRNKSGFERWLLDSSAYTAGRLYELEGTKYLRLHQFSAAAGVLKKVPQQLLNAALLPNPFVAHISERYELDATDTGKWYTKLAFAEAMTALEGRLATDAGAQFDYGAGLYSMTYYGKAAHAYTYYRSSSDDRAYFSGGRQALPQPVQEYYGALKAEQAFVKAAAMATDPALKAKSLFMAARCWQKRCPGKGAGYYYDEAQQRAYYINSLQNPYFRQLKEGYSTLPFFSRATGTCGYFRDYVKRGK